MNEYQIFDFGLLHLEWTNALFVFLNFILVMYLINRLLFRPILNTLKNRENSGQNSLARIEELNKKRQDLQESIKQKIAQNEEDIHQYKDQHLTDAKEKANSLIEKVKTKINKELENVENLLNNEVTQIEKLLELDDTIGDKKLRLASKSTDREFIQAKKEFQNISDQLSSAIMDKILDRSMKK